MSTDRPLTFEAPTLAEAAPVADLLADLREAGGAPATEPVARLFRGTDTDRNIDFLVTEWPDGERTVAMRATHGGFTWSAPVVLQPVEVTE